MPRERRAEREAQIRVEGKPTGTVTLTGAVRSWAEKRAALGAARVAPGVRSVEDHLDINPWGQTSPARSAITFLRTTSRTAGEEGRGHRFAVCRNGSTVSELGKERRSSQPAADDGAVATARMHCYARLRCVARRFKRGLGGARRRRLPGCLTPSRLHSSRFPSEPTASSTT